MTIEMMNRIKNELRKAFAHCGETDPAIIDEKVENELDAMLCFMASSDPDVVRTDKGELTGYLVDIAVSDGDEADEIVALQMIVTKDNIHYILNSYKAVKPDGWEYGDDINVEDETNRLVNLSDVDPAIFIY